MKTNPEGLRGFWSLIATQFQGAFSDNALKNLVLFLVVGMGLPENVRERLAIQFGERASFSATPGYDSVWIAEIRMPLLRDGPAAGRESQGIAAASWT